MTGAATTPAVGSFPGRAAPSDDRRAEEPERRAAPGSTAEAAHPPGIAPRVLWTRGAQCQVLAEVLGGGTATQAGANVAESCIRTRASLLVSGHLNSLDLCNLAVPHGFSPGSTRSIVAAVGSGPHSRLAATLAYALARQLGVPVRAVYGHHDSSERSRALAILNGITAHLPGIDVEPVQAPNPAAMVSGLPVGALLVVGAPGGAWFQRQFFGPGARIRAKAPSGTIVVKHVPARVYQIMQSATAFGPHMRVVDARRLTNSRHLIVAQDGRLLGLVTDRALAEARPDLELRDVMESPVFLSPEEDLDHAAELVNHHRGRAIPVVDSRHRIIGIVTATDLVARPPF